MIEQGFIHDLLARVDIVDVIGRAVALKKAGQNYLGLCPFHGEKTPSFTVSPSKQFFHCFGCGAHGSAIGFLMDHRGLGYVEAVQELAQMVGLPLATWERLFIWLAIGLVVYTVYGRRHALTRLTEFDRRTPVV